MKRLDKADAHSQRRLLDHIIGEVGDQKDPEPIARKCADKRKRAEYFGIRGMQK